MFKSQRSQMSKLRTVLSLSRNAEALRDLPERLTEIIDRYDTANMNPEYRTDIFTILDSAVAMAEALLDETYDASVAIQQVTAVMSTLPRVINHLSTRPTTMGFSILNPANATVYPQVYSTEGEAHKNLESLQHMGAARHCLVIPVKVHSQYAIQPKRVRLAPPRLPPTGPIPLDSNYIPNGIKPSLTNVPTHEWELPTQENETHSEDFGFGQMTASKVHAATTDPNSSIPVEAQSDPVPLPKTAAGEATPTYPQKSASEVGGKNNQHNIDEIAPLGGPTTSAKQP